jgi:hypothetical protein
MSISTLSSCCVSNISKLARSDTIFQIIPRLRGGETLGIILGIERGTWTAHKVINFAPQ